MQDAPDSGTIQTISSYSNGLLHFSTKRSSTGRYVHIRFNNKIFDFIFPKKLYATLIHLFEPSKSVLFSQLKFGWSYTNNLKSFFYKPQDVFLDFDEFESLLVSA